MIAFTLYILISSTGLLLSTAYVNRTARWGLMVQDFSHRTVSLWWVHHTVWLISIIDTQQSHLSILCSSNLIPALTLRWAGNKGVWSWSRGSAAISRSNVPTSLLHFWKLCRRKGEIQVLCCSRENVEGIRKKETGLHEDKVRDQPAKPLCHRLL